MDMSANPKTHNAGGQPGEVDNQNTQSAFRVSYPDPASVKGRVLADLLQGRCPTHLDTWRAHGSSRLAAHIHRLRKAGWPVITDDVRVTTTDNGRRADIARYRLPEGMFAALGQRAEQFIQDVRGA